jgi:hypothetical protein
LPRAPNGAPYWKMAFVASERTSFPMGVPQSYPDWWTYEDLDGDWFKIAGVPAGNYLVGVEASLPVGCDTGRLVVGQASRAPTAD